jgi:hypothetical protein
MIRGVTSLPPKAQLLQWLFWAGCGLAVLGGVLAVLLPLGGENRIGLVAIPFGIGAAALAALALNRQLDRWIALLLYALAAIAITYGLMVVASVPLRLAVLGTCPSAPQACPVGFEQPLSGRENLALEVAVALGIVALLATLAALEVQFQPRLRVIGRSTRSPEAPAPPPEMRASAIVAKPKPAQTVPDAPAAVKPEPEAVTPKPPAPMPELPAPAPEPVATSEPVSAPAAIAPLEPATTPQQPVAGKPKSPAAKRKPRARKPHPAVEKPADSGSEAPGN